MSITITLQQTAPAASLAGARGTAPAAGSGALVGDLPAALRLLCNLSGFGRKSRIDRLFSPRAVAQRIELRTADGDGMTVEVSGTGRPMLLVHGLGGSHHDWDGAVAQLARTHRVHTFDLRGHGARAAADARPTLQQMAADLALVIERLSIERPLLVGHSMGALVVMQYLQHHGADQLSGVCFVDQSPRLVNDEQWSLGLWGTLTRPQVQSVVTRLQRDFVETVIGELLSRLAPLRRACASQGLAGRLLRKLLAGVRDNVGVAPLLTLLQDLSECDFRGVIDALRLPTLVVLGGASHHYGGVPLAGYYESALRRGTVTTYERSAHSPHRQEAARFAADLAEFAERHCN